jgi:hypothetical protein
MKKIIVLVSIFVSSSAFAQQRPETKNIPIVDSGQPSDLKDEKTKCFDTDTVEGTIHILVTWKATSVKKVLVYNDEFVPIKNLTPKIYTWETKPVVQLSKNIVLSLAPAMDERQRFIYQTAMNTTYEDIDQ